MRIGIGYDVHKLVEGRNLIIGGVEYTIWKRFVRSFRCRCANTCSNGFILGAFALGDIGKHFPDTDDKYKGADSMKLLEFVYNLIMSKGYKIGNIDCIIIAQSPKDGTTYRNYEE